MVQTSFTIIETRLYSSGRKNMLVITDATSNSRTERISRWRRPRFRNAMRNQDCLPPRWMASCDARQACSREATPTGPCLRLKGTSQQASFVLMAVAIYRVSIVLPRARSSSGRFDCDLAQFFDSCP